MRKIDDTKLGKFLSLVLRHKPETIGIALDKNGWADVKELIEKVKLSGRYIDMEILESIKEKGILKRNRQYVHLSKDIETARSVGQRHGEVIILPIDIQGLKNIGHKFYLSENKVWLCDDIPSKYILCDKVIR